jgi:hypothetical protein
MPTPAEWVSEGELLPVNNWADVRRYRDRAEGYTFVEGAAGRYLALDRQFVLAAVRNATIARTGGTLDRVTGGLRRGGADEVNETRRWWAMWSARRFADHGPAK